MCYDLLEAQNKGENAYSQFQHQRLECSQKDFFERLPRLSLKTFNKANEMGTLNKTNKSVLVRKLETNVPPANEIPRTSACIIDGMSLIQKMKGDNLTFEELSDQLFHRQLVRE